MNYDPLQAEIDWRNNPIKQGKKRGILSEKQLFPNRLVRSELGNVLALTGCRSDSTVLDIGCGSGEDLEYVSKVTKNITGIDISPTAIEAFKAKGYKGEVVDVKKIPFPDASFDYVLCSAVLHHLVGQGDLTGYVEEFVRVLRPGGYLIALEPNAFSISGILMNIGNAVKPGVTGLVPHERALSPLSLKKIFHKTGLTRVKCIAASYTWNRYPLWISRVISWFEKPFKSKIPFCYFGWFSIISGQK